jgi:hypothetical protein
VFSVFAVNVVSVLDADRWSWDGADRSVDRHLGRECVLLSSVEGAHLATVVGVDLEDGVVEADVSITGGRSFHGVVWRVRGSDYESFFVRPHQNGNPDAIQYTPVCNGMAAWQLHHGDGFWNAVRFPLDDWLTVRVAFAREAVAVSLGGEQVLHTRLLQPVLPGAFGLIVGGDDLRVAEVRFEEGATVPSVAAAPADPDAVTVWDVSEPLAENDVPETLALGGITWTTLEAEPSGLTNLSRLHAISDEANTVYVRTTIESELARRQPLELGFSDRAVVFLNGQRIYRGDDTYRSRDYRFLGSIGWFDTLYLPLAAGENELVVAVSEDFGGWGIQARLPA